MVFISYSAFTVSMFFNMYTLDATCGSAAFWDKDNTSENYNWHIPSYFSERQGWYASCGLYGSSEAEGWLVWIGGGCFKAEVDDSFNDNRWHNQLLEWNMERSPKVCCFEVFLVLHAFDDHCWSILNWVSRSQWLAISMFVSVQEGRHFCSLTEVWIKEDQR